MENQCLSDNYILECPECNHRKFKILFSTQFLMADCCDCGRCVFYVDKHAHEIYTKVKTDTSNSVSFDELPF